MSLISRIFLVIRANLNHLIGQAEDPVKQLDLIKEDFTEDLAKMRTAVATAIASHNRLESAYVQALSKYEFCQKGAALALQKGNESLARDFLAKQQSLDVTSLKEQVTRSLAQANTLKARLSDFERQIARKKNQVQFLKSQAMVAQAQEQFEKAAGKYGELDKIAEKVEMRSGKAMALQELSSDPIEAQFKSLEGNLDDELLRLKAELGMSDLQLPLPSNVRYLPKSNRSVSVHHEISFHQDIG